jgi:hypothetical protein
MRCLVLIGVTVLLSAYTGRLLAGNLFNRNTGCCDAQPSCAAPPRPCAPPCPPPVCPPAPTQEIVVHLQPPPQAQVQQVPTAAVMQPAAESATSEHCSHAVEFGSITIPFPRFELPRLFRVLRNQQVSIPVAASAFVPAAQVASQAPLPVATQAVAQAAIPVAVQQVVPAAAAPPVAAAAQAAPMTLEQLVCELRIAQARQAGQQQAAQAASAQLQQIERLEAELRRLEELLNHQRTHTPDHSHYQQPYNSSPWNQHGIAATAPQRSYPHTVSAAPAVEPGNSELSYPQGITHARYDQPASAIPYSTPHSGVTPPPYPFAQRLPLADAPPPSYRPAPRITGVTPVYPDPQRLLPAQYSPLPVR